MYLKSLVLKGFKSFADKSVLSLEPGLTAIVGPNGSGKSNISDAVLWVLGERNAKNLRGQIMEDVIFAGSSDRKSVGVAEVELVLDNSDGSLPIDYSEVSIGRRLYRSGESEYLINGFLARRMDVLDILHDSGLGTGTHSIISQGNLESILQSRPEDRRALIEEAAGVLKHKQRKEKSERKLLMMDQHLERVNDVVAEIKRQLKPMERRAKRAIEYKKISVDLVDAKLKIAVDDLRILQRKWDKLTEDEKECKLRLQEKSSDIAKAEEKSDELQRSLQQESRDAIGAANKQRRFVASTERMNAISTLLQERKRSFINKQSEAKDRSDDITSEQNTISQQVDELNEQLSQANIESGEIAEQLQQVEAQYLQSHDRRVLLENQNEKCGQEISVLEDEIQRKNDEFERFNESLLKGISRQEFSEQNISSLKDRIDSTKQKMSELQMTYKSLDDSVKKSSSSEQVLEDRLKEALSMRDSARKQYDEAYNSERSIDSEIRGLEEIDKAASYALSPARSWLLEQDTDIEYKTLLGEISVDSGYERLLECLLASDATALLVENTARIQEIGNSLGRCNESGEVVLLSCDDSSLVTSSVRDVDLPNSAECLIDKLTVNPAYRRAVEALLGDVVVCKDLQQALDLHKEVNAAIRFATYEGSVVWPNGKVTLGTNNNDDFDGAFIRAKKISLAKNRHREAVAQLEEVSGAEKAAEANLHDIQGRLLQAKQESASLVGRRAACNSEIDSAKSLLETLEEELNTAILEAKKLNESVLQSKESRETYDQVFEDLSNKLTVAKEKQKNLREELSEAWEHENNLSNSLSEMRQKKTSFAERINYINQTISLRKNQLLDLQKEIDEVSKIGLKGNIYVARIDEIVATIEKICTCGKVLVTRLEEIQHQVEEGNQSMQQRAADARQAVRLAHDSYNATNERLNDMRIEKGKLEIQVEAAARTITQDCNTAIEVASKMPELENRQEVVETAERLERRIKSMGTINPDAANEYEELKARYDYLDTQLNDLISARNSLKKVDEVINARMKDDFVVTFQTVNENFKDIFALLFPGGSAELVLLDPDDLETTGVEVKAQPAGKRITKMSLMSGGEKSLVALALLFAVYKTRSTPFYILDEVEAALDDVNLRRLLGYLNVLRNDTQFILITHQRRTMENADVLFGVTMQGNGVTKVISQKLERALKYAK